MSFVVLLKTELLTQLLEVFLVEGLCLQCF